MPWPRAKMCIVKSPCPTALPMDWRWSLPPDSRTNSTRLYAASQRKEAENVVYLICGHYTSSPFQAGFEPQDAPGLQPDVLRAVPKARGFLPAFPDCGPQSSPY
jgi:hypothetical protein